MALNVGRSYTPSTYSTRLARRTKTMCYVLGVYIRASDNSCHQRTTGIRHVIYIYVLYGVLGHEQTSIFVGVPSVAGL